MARRAATIAALGAGAHDGEHAILAFGSTELPMRWNLAAAKWLSVPEPSIVMRGDWKLQASGAAVAGDWQYVADPFGTSGQIGQASYTYSPRTLRDAAAAYAAGLHLQQNLSHVFWNFSLGQIIDLGVILYNVNDGDMISTLAVPAPNLGIFLPSGNGQRKFQTTGWLDSTIPTPAKPLLAPHLYSRWVGTGTAGSFHLEYLRAMHRWSS